MTTTQLLEVIGPEIESRIICGKYGDTSLHKAGYVVGDPCYWGDVIDAEILAAEKQAVPARWNTPVGIWHEFQWRGRRCFFTATGGDGVGPLGHSVDSGEIAAVPVEFVPAWEQLQAI